MKAYASILRNFILPAGDFLCGQRMIRRLRFLEEAQWWSAEKIREERLRLLQGLVRTAYHETAFYRELMDSARVKPEDIRSLEDMEKIPAVTKAMIRRAYPEKISRSTGQRAYESRTSGSTGENFAVLEDAATAGWYRASFLLSLEWSGWSLGEPHLQTGMTLDRGFQKKVKDMLLRASYFSAFDLTDECLDGMLQTLEEKKIRYLWGYPGSLYYLALRAGKKGWNRPLKSAVTWGDTLFPHYRKEIEKVFSCRVFDTYGCAEGMQIAAQCEQGVWHIHDLDVLVEFTDGKGNKAGENTEANLVMTRLHAGPMPLMRYRIGDVGVRGPQRPCACGRGFQTMEGLRGRETDVVVTPSGNRLIVHFFTGIFEHFTGVESFQVVQETADSLRVFLAVHEGGNNAGLERSVRAALEEKGLSGMKLEIEFVCEIPLKAGKRRFVINKTFLAPQVSNG